MYWEQMTYTEWIISTLPFYCDCHDACVYWEWENVMWQLDGKHWLMDNINRQIKWPPTQITASASVRDKLNKLCYTSSFLLQYSLRSIGRLKMEKGTKEGSKVTDGCGEQMVSSLIFGPSRRLWPEPDWGKLNIY